MVTEKLVIIDPPVEVSYTMTSQVSHIVQ